MPDSSTVSTALSNSSRAAWRFWSLRFSSPRRKCFSASSTILETRGSSRSISLGVLRRYDCWGACALSETEGSSNVANSAALTKRRGRLVLFNRRSPLRDKSEPTMATVARGSHERHPLKFLKDNPSMKETALLRWASLVGEQNPRKPPGGYHSLHQRIN